MPTITHLTDEESPAIATLFRIYQPIEHYLRLSADHASRTPAPAATLTAIDLFLMHLITTYYPAPLSIVDLAADATAGVSTFFWANEQRAARVVTACQQEKGTPHGDWRSSFRDTATQLGANAAKVTLTETPTNGAAAWKRLMATSALPSPLLVTLAASDETSAAVGAQIARIFDLRPDALLCLLPLGPVGDCPALQASLEFCVAHTEYRLTALRESSPFFASSQLGLICQRANAYIPEVLERIRQLYEGNFQFLSLVRELTTTLLREEATMAKIRALESAIEEKDAQLRASSQEDQTQEEQERLAQERIAQEQIAQELINQERIAQEQIAQELINQERIDRNAYARWLESRLSYLEEELLPWKNEYIEQLENHLRNLESSKALKVGHAVRRLTSLAGSLKGK